MKKGFIIVLVLLLVTAGVLFSLSNEEKKDKVTASVSSKPDVVETTLKKMTLEEKVGQLFFACVYGSDVSVNTTEQYQPGGYVLFADFFEGKDKKTAKAAIQTLQKQSTIPLLIGTDEEGGTVTRISQFPAYRSSPFLSPQQLYQKGGLDLVETDAGERAKLLLSLGMNVNLAPVCDVSTDPNDYMYPRTAGKGPEATGKYAATFVSASSQAGIGTVLKHFPGYGDNVDTHTGIAKDSRTLAFFQENDFIPFEAGINAGADSVLVSHNIIEAMDSQHPASLSPAVHEVLRKDLNFSGVIMTDDLSMDAIQQYSGDENTAVAAITAGNDLLCTGNFQEQIPAVIKAVKKGTISPERIDRSVERILHWKMKLNLLK